MRGRYAAPSGKDKMKCTFTRSTYYKSQLFLKGKTYDLGEIDAAALGFKVSAKVLAAARKAQAQAQAEAEKETAADDEPVEDETAANETDETENEVVDLSEDDKQAEAEFLGADETAS